MWLLTSLYDEPVHSIFGMTIDYFGNIYFTTRNKELCKINSTDQSSPQCLLKHKTIIRELVWNGDNLLYICDWSGQRILLFDLQTNRVVDYVGTGEAKCIDGTFNTASFCYPWGMCMDNQGNLLVTDQQSLRKVDFQQKTVNTIYHFESSKLGSVACKDGIIYVCNRRRHLVHKIENNTTTDVTTNMIVPRCVKMTKDGTHILVSDARGLWGISKQFPPFIILRKNGISSLTVDRKGCIYVGTTSQIIRLDQPWSIQRLLWLAHLKEDANYCQLSKLPKDIMKVILAKVKWNHFKQVEAIERMNRE